MMRWLNLRTLTRPWAQRKRQRGCASSDHRLLRTPWQNTRAPASGNTQTSWPGKGDGRCWPFRRSFSRTSDWRGRERLATSHTHQLLKFSLLWIRLVWMVRLPVHLVPSYDVSFLQSFDCEHLPRAFVLCQQNLKTEEPIYISPFLF